MTAASDYYLNGYLRGKLKNHQRLVEILNDLAHVNPREGFRWEQKYQNTLDLRPNVHAYDPCFMDVLMSSSVPTLINDVIGPDLVMVHIQVRRSFPGPSYMDWHRDSYRHGLHTVGNFPPVHKLIFYPLLGLKSEAKLKLVGGSHRRVFDSLQADLKGVHDLPYIEYASSDDEFILFETSILHGVIPDKHELGSIRVIYSFIRRSQYELSLIKQSIHREQVELYTQRIS
jgi:hypothetical protein